MSSADDTSASLVMSYLTLRKAVGIIGTSLPLVLVIGKMLLDGPGIQDSISAYYYTSMRNVFVGSLCAIAVFLICYRYDRVDDIVGNLAGAFAIGVALFPTQPATDATTAAVWVGKVHLTFAAAFFCSLAYFCLALFRRTHVDGTMTPQKVDRNRVYTVCGYAIVACIVLIFVDSVFLRNSGLARFDPVFWLETVAVISFGVSWLTKGETLLGDLKPEAEAEAAPATEHVGLESPGV